MSQYQKWEDKASRGRQPSEIMGYLLLKMHSKAYPHTFTLFVKLISLGNFAILNKSQDKKNHK